MDIRHSKVSASARPRVPASVVSASPRARVPASGERVVEIPPFAMWETRGGNAGTPVVLVHGLSGSSRWWKRNMPALASKHSVAAVDLIGFGKTRAFGKPTRLPPSFDSLVATLIRYIAETFDQPVHLVGHSMGGQIAIHVAAQRSDLVRSLVLVNPTGVPMNFDLSTRLRNLMYPAAGLLSFSPLLLWDFLRAGPTSIAVASARLFADDAREDMRKITVPTLLVWGDRDPLLPLSYAQQVKEQIPSARMIVLQDAGHVSMWDAAEDFNEEVLKFLEEIDHRGMGHASERSRGPGQSPFTWGVSGFVDGIAYRASGDNPQVLLIHGLGIGTRYFLPLARELHKRGIHCVAPDLPGCGYSAVRSEPVGAWGLVFTRWLEQMNFPPMAWVGHSAGCQLIEQMAQLRADRVLGCIEISPPWNLSKHPWWKLAGGLFLDFFQEPPAVMGHAIRAYWDSGMLRVWRMARFYVPHSRREPRYADLVLVGKRDPLFDSAANEKEKLRFLPGAHAVVFSRADHVADEITSWLNGIGS